MAKTAQYLRGYRSRRTANKGRLLGRPLSRSEQADVDILVNSYGYSRAKAVQETRYVNEQLRIQSQIAKGDFSGIAPRGRAPRGLGAEYRARQQIADLFGRADRRGANARYRGRNYRGAKAGRYDASRRSGRAGLTPYLERQAKAILQGSGSWAQKAADIRGVYEHASYFLASS